MKFRVFSSKPKFLQTVADSVHTTRRDDVNWAIQLKVFFRGITMQYGLVDVAGEDLSQPGPVRSPPEGGDHDDGGSGSEVDRPDWEKCRR